MLAVLMQCGTIAENLLRNPSFGLNQEVGARKDWRFSFGGLKEGAAKLASALRTDADGRTGTRALLIKPDSVEWVFAQHIVDRSLRAGEEYVFSVWLKSKKTAQGDFYLGAVPADNGKRFQARRSRKEAGESWKNF